MSNNRSFELSQLDLTGNPLPDALLDVVGEYALSDNVQKVEELLSYLASLEDYETEFFDEVVHHALYHYAFSGCFHSVNYTLKKYSALWFEALRGYQDSGLLSDPAVLLRILACTEDTSLRGVIALRAYRDNPELSPFKVLQQAARIVDAMESYLLSYEEAKAFMGLDEGSLVWLLQGPQMVQDGKIPYEIFIKISEYVSGLEGLSVDHVHSALNQRLLHEAKNAVHNHPWNHFLFFCCPNQRQKKVNELKDLNVLRGNFYSHW